MTPTSASLVLVAVASLGAGGDVAVFPPGTTLPIRFLQSVTSGRTPEGTRVRVQTMGPLEADGCVIVPPYTEAAGVVTVSRGGRAFGGRGVLVLRFDSLETELGTWASIAAVLDSLEYTPAKNLTGSGVAYGNRGSVAKRAVPFGLAGVSDVSPVPVVVLGGYWIARRGAAARIVAGETGRLRLIDSLAVPRSSACAPRASDRALPTVPRLPDFFPRSETKDGRPSGDPMNLVLLGTPENLDTAFSRAGWVGPKPGSVGSVTEEIVAGLTNHQAIGAPLSTQYFQGRRQDLAFQLAGPNARFRHHARLWALDSAGGVWVGAATQDIGVRVNPFKGRFTHRINPFVDDERDRIVKELEATGCADLVDYVSLPNAATRGRNATGQAFVSDGRAAVISVRPCERLPIAAR